MLRIASYNFKAIAEGSLSLIPGTTAIFNRGTQGTNSARYCYSVWLRHLVRSSAYRKRLFDGLVVELGPGDSLGIGLAALLSGARWYTAIDVVHHANVERNLAVLAELVRLFTARTPIPDDQEFPLVNPQLADYAFPHHLLDSDWMVANLAPARVNAIAAALRDQAEGLPMVRYVSPDATHELQTGSACLVFSQAVLEHVDDLSSVYAACHAWLEDGGMMSHQIDFKSHGTSRVWNGHWAYPTLVWKLIRGRRPYLLNREPCGTHLRLMETHGFEILEVERMRLPSPLRRDQLSSELQGMGCDDMTTSGAFVMARKRPDQNSNSRAPGI